ncbi:AAA family ATPase [Actinoplanes palleronii]|uniref:Novel STAND NTPase 1 domain-containing protein n=1 Tax=Actinoplanes palleronii TaxID=113570 RepID=A0ABQ4B6H3_9ACTN|nr:AAA family ATPase [Actinoplanes palleronii]GIE66289.1 hypothetical protein Apa02nite_023970 [Actinoplanes palleronii]
MIGLPDLSSPGTRIVLAGTGTHRRGVYPTSTASESDVTPIVDVPQVKDTLVALRQAFIERCGVNGEQIIPLLDPADPRELGDGIRAAARAATEVFLLYYVGHGLISGEELYLATSDTTDGGDSVGYTGLAYAQVRTLLRACGAKSIVVVLDCCFSGRANNPPGAAAVAAFGMTYIRGGCLLASAAGEEAALILPDEPYPAFSGAFINMLNTGDPLGPARLTVASAYEHLVRELPPGVPRPHLQQSGRAGRLILAPNPAYRVPIFPVDEPTTADAECPYPGLQPFSDARADYFFGREQLVDRLIQAVAERFFNNAPLVVIGASGAGKSSLLCAGMVPAIRNGALRISGAHRWPVEVMTPKEDPLASLAYQLQGLTGRAAGELVAVACKDTAAFSDLVESALGEDDRLILVVDQFEELFTVTPNGAVKKRFLEVLGRLCGLGKPMILVVGVRADFYAHCAALPLLAPSLGSQILVGPMDVASLRQAIDKPAKLAGLAVEPGLPELLLRDLNARDPDTDGEAAQAPSLPLLSYALRQTWLRSGRAKLTLAGYQATGGILEAVANSAEDTYKNLSDRFGQQGQDAARELMLSLVHAGDGRADTRRRVRLTDLFADGDTAQSSHLKAALDAFDNARLITIDGHHTEVAHEALVRAWPRLQEWLHSNRTGLLAHQRLTEAADLWQNKNRNPDALIRGAVLADARAVLQRPARRLTPTEKDFIAASEEERRAAEAAVQRTSRRFRVLSGILAVLLVAAGGLGVKLQRANLAQRQITAASDSRGLIAEAELLRDTRPDVSIRLSLEAIARDPANNTARTGLIDTMIQTRHDGVLTGHLNPVTSVAYAPSGQLLASGARDGAVMLWNPVTRTRVAVIGAPVHESKIRARVAFRDAHTLVVISNDRGHRAVPGRGAGLTFWNIDDPTHPSWTGTLPLDGFLSRMALSSDGTTLLVAESDPASISAWNITDLHHPRRIPGWEPPFAPSTQPSPYFTGDGEPQTLALTPDGKTAVIAYGDPYDSPAGSEDSVELRQVSGGKTISTFANSAGGQSDAAICHNHGRTLLAYAGGGGKAHVRDITDPRHPGRSTDLIGHTDTVFDLVCNADGTRLATSASDGIVKLWNIERSGRAVYQLDLRGHQQGVGALAFSPDGTSLASGGNDVTVRLWRVSTAAPTQIGVLRQKIGLSPPAFVGTKTPMVLLSGPHASVHVLRPDGTDIRLNPALGKQLRGCVSAVHDQRIVAMIDCDVSGPAGGPVTLWDFGQPTSPRFIAAIPGTTGWKTRFVANGKKIVVYRGHDSDNDSTTLLYSVGEQPMLLDKTDNIVDVTAVTRDGHRGVFKDASRVVAYDLSDPIRPRLLHERKEVGGGANTAALHPAGGVFATVGENPFVRLWRIGDDDRIELITRLKEHTSVVRDLAFNDTGTILVTGGNDRTAIIWDVTDPDRPAVLARIDHGSPVNGVELAADDGSLLLSGLDGPADVWDISRLAAIHADPVGHACLLAGPKLSNDDRSRYLPDTELAAAC